MKHGAASKKFTCSILPGFFGYPIFWNEAEITQKVKWVKKQELLQMIVFVLSFQGITKTVVTLWNFGKPVERIITKKRKSRKLTSSRNFFV